ncbi:MAG: glycosyltransferase family 39 protein [bacterium]|nr:glycosyltransferase family 39 protein [bacterium]
MPTRSNEKTAPLERAAVVVLLLVFAVQAVAGMRLFNASSDETYHLPAGYSYLTTGDLRLNPEHPPLAKELAALPLLLLRPELDTATPAWNARPPRQLEFGTSFLYSNDADRLLFWARVPTVLLALLCGWHVWRWSRELFGPLCAGVALFLYAFSPTVLGHSRFVTFDVPLACFHTLALYYLWRWTKSGGAKHLIVAGVCVGAALGTKFSGVVLLPSIGLLLLAAIQTPARDRGVEGLALGRSPLEGPTARRVQVVVVGFGLLCLLAAFVVWAAYLFPRDPQFYLRGIRLVNANHNPNYYFYLLGEFKQGGWWYYSLVAFLIKTPVVTLALLALSLVTFRRLRAGDGLDELFLIVPAVVFAAVTCAKANNLGIRYLLPIYPLLFVFVSRVGLLIPRRRALAAAAAGLALWYAGAALWIYPDQLAYFNELVGGPGRGHRYLDDSNIDWGQDLKRLDAELERRGIDRVSFLYGWNGDPEYYGIPSVPLRREDWTGDPAPGYYVIGTHRLIRGRLMAQLGGVKSDWVERYEPIGRVGYSFWIYRF